MLRIIIAKEWKELARERRACLALLAIPALLAGALAVGAAESAQLEAGHREAREEARRNWLEQGDHGGHSAAHHGTYLFRGGAPLAPFDPGLDPYLGATIRIEAHHRHRPANAPAQEAPDPLRIDASTPALLLQVVAPLATIALGFASVSREREQGTLPLLLGLGVPARRLILGKACAILIAAAAIASPAIPFLALATLGPAPEGADAAMRAVLLAGAYAMFLAGWAFFALGVSARARSSRMSLVVLIAAWGAGTLVVPRVASAVAGGAWPLPTQEEFDRWNDAAMRTEDGRSRVALMAKELEAELLERHGVESREELPMNFDAVALQAGEELSAKVQGETRARLSAILDRQDRLAGAFAVLSPALAIRGASMALAGTDRAHHEAFDAQAESYRGLLVRTLNEADAARGPSGGPGAGGRALWERVPDFEHRPPGWREALRSAGPSLAILGAWAGLSAALALSARPSASPRD